MWLSVLVATLAVCAVDDDSVRRAREVLLDAPPSTATCADDAFIVYTRLADACGRSFHMEHQLTLDRCAHNDGCERRAELLRMYGLYSRHMRACATPSDSLVHLAIGPI
jgi:hypothetical protein